ncbi:MAG: hypothetical protein JWN25_1970 [Verrucomicrobiales bacterium]|nr:hypothetical protein [Verrucomicrobiales bacterium]
MRTSRNHDSLSLKSNGFTRRHFLKGLGACMAVPALESLMPGKVFGAQVAAGGPSQFATTATGAPLRSAFIFFPNGSIPGAWWPKTKGTDYELGPTLQPLESSRNLIQILGGLDHQNATGGADGGGDHARGTGVFLTGVRLNKSATDIRCGISIDQVIAKKVGHMTRLPSLELTCDNVRKTAACDSGYSCAYQFNISWASSTTPMTPEANPRLVFERLFGSGAPGERVQNTLLRQKEQRSVLDFVMNDAKRMQNRVNSGDKAKLDQYLTGVRDIETRIQQAERFGAIKDPMIETPAGVPTEHAEYVSLMYDMLALAFQTDSTRVATLTLAGDGSNRSFPDIGIAEGHHDISHHQNNPDRIAKVAKIDLWYAKQFGKFLDKLQNIKDIDGNSVLHNSMIVYGGGNADGNRHTHSNLPIVLAGAGGGTLQVGRYANMGSKPATNLFLSLADRMGLQGVERFGDSTSRLSSI